MSQYQLMSLLGNVHALEHKRLENELSVRIWWMAILFLSGYSKYLQLLIRCITWCDKRNTFFMREIGCSAVCVYRYWSSGFGGQLNCFACRKFCTFYKVMRNFFRNYLLSLSKMALSRWLLTKRESSFIFNVFVRKSKRKLPIWNILSHYVP